MRKIFFFISIISLQFLSNSTSGKTRNDDTFLPGYVVLGSRDTINGFILIKDHYFNTRNCVYKETNSATTKIYPVENIIAYGVRGKKYFKRASVGMQSSTATVFLECLVSGSVSLFSFESRFFLENQGTLNELKVDERAVIRGDRSFTIKLESYKGTLQEAMKNCSSIFSEIGSTTLNKNDLIKLFINYHNCANQKYDQFTTDDLKMKVNLSIALGSALSGLRMASSSVTPYIAMDDKKPTYTMPIILTVFFRVFSTFLKR